MKRKHKIKKNILRATIAVIFMFLMSMSVVSVFAKVVSLNQEKTILKRELTLIQEEKTYLEGELERLKDDEYIARYAREKYLFSKEGEYIIKIQK